MHPVSIDISSWEMDWEILPQKKPQLAKPTKGFHHETHRYVQYTSL